ncbi:hypothetical protein EVB71_076 [Rhizobium phage RHph_Y55]|nr:hypothetical protein EVB71_076 [Rhizobium phage RHph_Y55]
MLLLSYNGPLELHSKFQRFPDIMQMHDDMEREIRRLHNGNFVVEIKPWKPEVDPNPVRNLVRVISRSFPL